MVSAGQFIYRCNNRDCEKKFVGEGGRINYCPVCGEGATQQGHAPELEAPDVMADLADELVRGLRTTQCTCKVEPYTARVKAGAHHSDKCPLRRK